MIFNMVRVTKLRHLLLSRRRVIAADPVRPAGSRVRWAFVIYRFRCRLC
jgi:hypothetical protein